MKGTDSIDDGMAVMMTVKNGLYCIPSLSLPKATGSIPLVYSAKADDGSFLIRWMLQCMIGRAV